MKRIAITLLVLLSHWRRRPGQFATLVIGLALATGLWTGVQAINSEARSSYAKAADAISMEGASFVVASDGGALAISDFVALRRAGWLVSPVIDGRRTFGRKDVRVIGIEPLTSPVLSTLVPGTDGPSEGASDETGLAFLRGEGVALVSPALAADLEGIAGLPRLVVSQGVAPGMMVVDISLAGPLLDRAGEIDRLVIAGAQPLKRAALEQVSPRFELREAVVEGDIGRLTDSFHLNLTAFGLLSFAVGLFIVHSTIGLAFEQRRTTFRNLRTMGVSAFDLTAALALELLAYSLLAGTLGVAFGYLIASLLLPDVAATLRGLYGAQVDGELGLRSSWWASGLAIALAGTFVAAAGSLWRLLRLPVLASAQPRAWAMKAASGARWQTAVAVAFLAISAILILADAGGLVIAFVTLGLVLVGSALLLPLLFGLVLRGGEKLAGGPLSQWFFADTRQQVPGLSLALMALLLALAANIGVSTMVGSFRDTFTGWLDKRLAAELYIRTTDETQRDEVLEFLQGKVDAVLPVTSREAVLAGQPGEIFAMADHATYREQWPMLEVAPGAWGDLAAGRGVLINEQLSRRQDLRIGDRFELPEAGEKPIVGIYSDYGNPAPQVIVGLSLFSQLFPDAQHLRFAVRMPAGEVAALAGELRQRFSMENDAVVDQATIKTFSLNVFERTFTVTDALNVLTLSVAGFAIFSSLLTLATMRLPQLAPLWALGLTRRKLAVLELVRSLCLASLTAIAALPVGLLLAWLLLARINVEAFGWRLPMELFPLDWLRLAAFALIAAVAAAAIPAWRLARTRPADLVKVFTHER